MQICHLQNLVEPKLWVFWRNLFISNLQTGTPKKFENLLIDNRYEKVKSANPQTLGLILRSQIRKFLGVPKLQINGFHELSANCNSAKFYKIRHNFVSKQPLKLSFYKKNFILYKFESAKSSIFAIFVMRKSIYLQTCGSFKS